VSDRRADCGSPFVHQAVLYDSDEEFLSLVLPLLRDGMAVGEPTFVCVDEPHERRVREELGDGTGVTYLHRPTHHSNPLSALRANLELFATEAKAGSGTVRVVGQTAGAAEQGGCEGWGRYESVVNHFYADLPVHSLCPYDRRITSPSFLDDVERTHPHLLTATGGLSANDRYTEPTAFLAERALAEIDALEETPPQVVRRDPSLVEAREAVAALAWTTSLDGEDLFGLVLAVNEAIANAEVHGRPPAELRAWAAADRVVVTVRDRGPGPASPFVGLLRCGAEGRLGLWLSNQLCSRVTLISDDDGFTIHLVAGTAQPLRITPAV